MRAQHRSEAAARPDRRDTPRLPPRSPPAFLRDWALGQWRWLLPATALAATAAWLAGITSGHAQGDLRLALIVVGAILTFTASGLPLWQHRRVSAAKDDAVAAAEAARTRMRVTLNDALDPLVHVISQISEMTGADKARRRGEAIQFTVNTIAAFADIDRVRVCFFRLDLGPPAGFHLDAFAGRAGAPDCDLTAGTAAGDAALRTLSEGHWVMLNDIRLEPPPFSWDARPEYRAVVIGPVQRAGLPVGVITLDALEPGDTAHVDLGVLRLLAELLAIALSA